MSERPRTWPELGLMQGTPPPPERLVTSDNWIEGPFNSWGFLPARAPAHPARVTRAGRAGGAGGRRVGGAAHRVGGPARPRAPAHGGDQPRRRPDPRASGRPA